MIASVLRLGLAWIHLIALAIGVGAVWSRARALHDFIRHPLGSHALRRAFVSDAWWGVAAALWLSTGLWRLLGHTEKSTSYYLNNQIFRLKITLFIAIVALEIWPMVTLTGWRNKKTTPNPDAAHRMEVISYVECALVIVIVLAAVSMARGFGAKSG